MKLFIGIGNPSPEYSGTRHNVGKVVISELNHYLNTDLNNDLKQKPDLSAEIELFDAGNGKKIVLANSLTYMNDSGWAVKAVASFYKIAPENIWVIHDEFDIPLGEVRESFDSRAAGHNGIKSIIQELGTQQFHRIRIGIHPAPKADALRRASAEETQMPLDKFVLAKFEDDEIELMRKGVEEAKKIIVEKVQSSKFKVQINSQN